MFDKQVARYIYGKTSEYRIVNMCIYDPAPHHDELKLSHVPECCRVVQAGMDALYAGSCVAIF